MPRSVARRHGRAPGAANWGLAQQALQGRIQVGTRPEQSIRYEPGGVGARVIPGGRLEVDLGSALHRQLEARSRGPVERDSIDLDALFALGRPYLHTADAIASDRAHDALGVELHQIDRPL